MYDTIIIGAGMSRAGGRDSAGVLRPAGLHSRAALHDRRAELVLPAPRPRLRRRPARAHQRHAEGHQDAARSPGCCGSCGCRGTTSRSRRRSARRSPFPACGCDSTTTRDTLRDEVACAFPHAGRQLRPAHRSEIVDYDDLERNARRHLGPRGRELDHHASRCWSRCCSAR